MITFLVTHNDNGGTQILWEKIAAEMVRRGGAAGLLAVYSVNSGSRSNWEVGGAERLKLRNLFTILLKLRRIISRRNTRAIVSALPLANILNAMIGPLSGARVRVITHHSPVSTYHPLLRWLDRHLGSTKCVTHVVCVSEGVRQSISSYPPAYLAKTVVIRNALSGEVKSKIELLRRDRSQPIVGRPARLIALGRLSAQKNYPTLIAAMARVENATLEICGDGPDRQKLEALRDRLGLGEKVFFLGHLDHEDALVCASRADVFLQPSLFEGHSIALLEAAELGLPLIVSDAPTQIEAVMLPNRTLAGIVVPVLDADALAAAINNTICQPGRLQQLSNAACELARITTFEKLVSSYASLLSNKT